MSSLPIVPTLDTPAAPHPSYKYQWARFVARENLEADFRLLNEKISAVRQIPQADNITDLVLRETQLSPGDPPKTDGKFKVGIIGAGCAGLFTAMIIDYLNKKVEGVNMAYDILEAGTPERLGGRLYTHYFSKEPHDYYDVGAMRFPQNDIMERTFKLFNLLGIDKKLIPYVMKMTPPEKNMCPSYYNDIRQVGAFKGEDPFEINKGLPADDQVPAHLLAEDPGTVSDRSIKGLADAFKKGLDNKGGWDQLMRADYMSTRQYFRETKLENLPDGPGYNFNTTEWLETFTYGTGWYNQSLSETVLESLDFEADKFFCIEGGTQQVAFRMADTLTKKPEFNMEVVGIYADKPDKSITRLKINNLTTQKVEERDYFAVFNSTTLAALQRMDLTKAGLRYGTKQAIRSLGYGASCKVGMKFKSGWWMKKPFFIKGGLGKTDLPLRVCVYPSYNLNDEDKECVLLCSYTWAQDAQRIGSLIHPDTPNHESELRDVLFHNLALLHANEEKPYEETLALIKSEYITHHAYDWYSDPNMSGAFAYFGPGQFSRMWPEVIRPNGWLFLIGEAASAHHAWIVGALESAVRGVYQMLVMLNQQKPEYAPYREAMDLLAEPQGDDKKLPFGPLPEELPYTLKGAEKGITRTDVPEKDKELSFTAAQVILSFLDLVVEQVAAEQKSSTK